MRSARVLAVMTVIFATPCGISKAAPIAPLTGLQTESSNLSQAWYGYHRPYYRRHYHGYYRPYYHGYSYGYFRPYAGLYGGGYRPWGWRGRWW